MKPRWGILAIVIPACLVMLLSGTLGHDTTAATPAAVATPTATSDPCQWARYFTNQGQLEYARVRYEALLDESDAPECAHTGLATVEAALVCRPVEALLGNGTPGAAINGFVALLAEDPNLACANEGFAAAMLEITPTAPPSPTPPPGPTSTPDFSEAIAIDRRGDTEAAATVVAGILASDPFAEIPPELSHLDDNPNNDIGFPFFDTAYDWMGLQHRLHAIQPWAEAWVWVLVPLLAGIGFIWLRIVDKRKERVRWKDLGWRQRWNAFWTRPVKIDIVTFSNGIKGDDAAADADLATLEKRIETAYRHVEQSRGKASSKLVLEAEAATKAPAILDTIITSATILKWVKFGWELVTLWRHKSYRLDGIVFRHPDRGDAIAVELRSGIRVIASQEMWADRFLTPWTLGTATIGDAGSWRELGETVAIWLHWVIAPNNESPDMSVQTLKWRNWESYAWFRNSRRAFDAGDRETQSRLVNQSLSRDPEFLPARANRAALRLGTVARQGLDESTARPLYLKVEQDLARIEADIEELGQAREGAAQATTLPPQWFTARFNRIAALDYAAGWDPVVPEHLVRALILAHDAINRIRLNGLSPDGQPGPNVDVFVDVQETLAIRRNMAQLATAGSMHYVDWSPSPRNYDDFANAYTLACLATAEYAFRKALVICAGARATPDQEQARDEYARLALDSLTQAMDLAPSLIARTWARFDPSLAPLRAPGNEQGQASVRQQFRQIVPQ